MARPKKNNADYFSHDNNMRNDPKIKALRRKFKEGYAVYNMFLEALTDAEFFRLSMTPLQYEILAGDFDVESKLLIEIVDYCVILDLLKRENDEIYSCGLNKRLQGVLDKRNAFKDRLLSQKLQKEYVTDTETPQSKVKESKVKESKVNNIKERKLKFADTLKPFVDFYGKDMVNDFYKYWTEPNASETKFRRELQKTWDVERRLETWAKRDKNFSNGKQNNNAGTGTGQGYKPASVDREELVRKLTEDLENGNIPGVY